MLLEEYWGAFPWGPQVHILIYITQLCLFILQGFESWQNLCPCRFSPKDSEWNLHPDGRGRYSGRKLWGIVSEISKHFQNSSFSPRTESGTNLTTTVVGATFGWWPTLSPSLDTTTRRRSTSSSRKCSNDIENFPSILDTRIFFLPSCKTLMLPLLDSETGWTGELWLKTNLLK